MTSPKKRRELLQDLGARQDPRSLIDLDESAGDEEEPEVQFTSLCSIHDYITAGNMRQSVEGRTCKLDAARQRVELDVGRVVLKSAKFELWTGYLVHQLNVLLYGPGSKFAILNSFADSMKEKGVSVLVVRGFSERFSLRRLFSAVLESLGVPVEPCPLEECLVRVLECLAMRRRDIYIFFHNLDGPALAAPEPHEMLSQLINHPRIRLAASIDNPYFLFILSPDSRLRYNFLYFSESTLNRYTEELPHQEKLAFFKTDPTGSQLRGFEHILKSMTVRQRDIIGLLAETQLRVGSHTLMNDFYSLCYDHTLATTSKVLKDNLLEAHEHQLIKYKNTPKGITVALTVAPVTVLNLINSLSGYLGPSTRFLRALNVLVTYLG